MGTESPVHILLVAFPGQGHVNPMLRLGNRLAFRGFLVTFSIAEAAGKQIEKANNITKHEPIPVGDGFIRFEFFKDGWEDDDPRRKDPHQYMPQLELAGKQMIPQMIKRSAEQGSSVSCLINGPFDPWVSDVAESLGIPSAVLWLQSCACFAAHYHYYHGLVPFPTKENPKMDVQLPCMPVLKHDEIPAVLHPFNPYTFARNALLGQYKNLDKPFCIVMDTFQELEHEIVDYMSKIIPIRTVGPLFKNPKVARATVAGDLLKADDCIEWLNTKPPSSVVYISFGSIASLKQDQCDEIAQGLINSGLPFLWVMREEKSQVLTDGFFEKVGDKGKLVRWSPQEKVLAHPSVACFLTHCGWNSSMEALGSGVPVVTFPYWGDQVTNSKYLVDVFEVGVRLSRGEAQNKLITCDEVEKCLLEVTVGTRAAEMKQNVLKWKAAAEAAMAEGGSSDRNFEAFVDDMKRRIAEVNSTRL
uniref:Glycosyltransferase n=1 Tax=Rhizophora mucronata TaxID=61149 RepID=A0A2P2JTY1_RHIMU